MLKKYFNSFGEIFKNAFLFSKETFKKHGLLIWLLIISQMFLIIPVLYFSKEFGFLNFAFGYKILASLALIAYFILFFVMFKKVFNLASLALKKENINNSRIIKSLLTLGIFNCIPFFMLLIFYNLALAFPNTGIALKIILSIFTFIFYLSMSLSIVSISKWQNKNIFVAIFRGIKTFFKKIHLTLPIFLIVFAFGTIISYLICTLIYAILIYSNFINENIVNTIHAIVNVYSLYIICNFYIGLQANVLEGENE